ncbi:GTP cyclohydrolase I [Leucobacter exalbidus]|uniref:GTP cyclohydrolase 1 n=1 Tax=Leucobacter exalbidus TaxID=662960 RepID=A0A940PKS2_9MICO|nr:GTP cyclohydrolase I [Leucobacter exalbidus]MBP1324848.1 GTP cyclohydrolase I [Leucobacter exalbidus]
MASHTSDQAGATDIAAATRAAGDLLRALGVDLEARGLERTPERVAQTLAGLIDRGPVPEATLMPSDGYDGPIVMRDIPFVGMCEHHLLPFRGTATLAYAAGEQIVGLSTLARVVEYFAAGLQLQERMTSQIADWLESELTPAGVGVRIEAEHFCMSMRGIGGPATQAETRITRGTITAQDLA